MFDDFEKKLQKCRLINDKNDKLNCMFGELYKITEKQDVTNIEMIKILNEDSDPRWKGLHMIDNANAIILGLSRNKCDPKNTVDDGYVGEKVDSLNDRWTEIKWLAKRGD